MSGNVRKSKWKRAKVPEPIVLQLRDKEIIASVYEFEFLTREQIQNLFNFHCTVRANIRLRKLFDHGYLSRRFLPTDRGSAKALYLLGLKGIQIVSEQSVEDPLEIKKKQQKLLEKKDLFFSHDLMVNTVRLSFYRAFKNYDGLNLERWISASDCLQEISVYNQKLNREEKIIFRPDGYFRYVHNEKLYSCFIEMDMSTMSNNRFQSKVMLYMKYAQSGFHQRRYGLKFFRVLTVTKTRERLCNLKAVTGKLTDKIFWFTTLANVTPDNILGQIWERPRRDGNFSLLEG